MHPLSCFSQGEDVVAGIRTPMPIKLLKDNWPKVYDELLAICNRLESHMKDMQDIEFTIQVCGCNCVCVCELRMGWRWGGAYFNISACTSATHAVLHTSAPPAPQHTHTPPPPSRVQDGRLFMLQCRSGKRTGPAALKIATDLYSEKLITSDEAVLMVSLCV